MNKYYAFTENVRNNSNKLLEDWIQQAQDMELVKFQLPLLIEGIGSSDLFKVLNKIKIPVIINGGIGNKVT